MRSYLELVHRERLDHLVHLLRLVQDCGHEDHDSDRIAGWHQGGQAGVISKSLGTLFTYLNKQFNVSQHLNGQFRSLVFI